MTVNGLQGELYLALEPDCSHTVTWIDPTSNIQFAVSAFYCDEDDILHMAESVILLETTK